MQNIVLKTPKSMAVTAHPMFRKKFKFQGELGSHHIMQNRC